MLKKCVVRHVLIEGIDNPVAIPPGIWPVFIAFKAAGVRVADDVQPVPSPALAVLRAGEETIDNLWPGIWSAILFECLNLFKCRGQPRQVKIGTPNQISSTRRRIPCDAVFAQTSVYKRIDDREAILCSWFFYRLVDRRKSPPDLLFGIPKRAAEVRSSCIQPARQIADFALTQLASRRH